MENMEKKIIAILEAKLEKVKEAQVETAKQMHKDTVSNAPNIRGDYVDSIKLGDQKEEDDIVSTSVYSNLLVGGDIPKWQDVPLSAFAEWGTGPLGESTNKYEHGYPYTTDEPWNAEAMNQFLMTGTWGRSAEPHFYPALQKNIALYKDNLRKAMK